MPTAPPNRAPARDGRLQTVFVVDDHPAYRRAIASVVELTTGARQCGEAVSGADALGQLHDTDPDLVVMDVHLTDMSGIVVTHELTARRPDLRVLLVSTMSEADLPADLATCGAIGFVRKDRFGPAVLSEALRIEH